MPSRPSRPQRLRVWRGELKKTSGGLTRDDLVKNSKGKIVSRRKSKQAGEQNNLGVWLRSKGDKFGDKPKEAKEKPVEKPKVLKEKAPVKKQPPKSYGKKKNKSEITVENIPDKRESRTQKKERIKRERLERARQRDKLGKRKYTFAN